MQNRTFLVLLRPIFCKKLKIGPPLGKQPPLKRLNFRIWQKNLTKFRWRPFFFFWRPPDFGRKNVWISELSEKFRLNFRTNRVKLIQEQWKFGSRSIALFSLFQNSPPPPFPNPGYAPDYKLNNKQAVILVVTLSFTKKLPWSEGSEKISAVFESNTK